MDPQDLKDSMDALVTAIKQMPKGILDMIRPPAGGGMPASTLAGGLAGGGIAKLGGMVMGMVPQFRSFGREFGNLVDLLKTKNQLLKQGERLGSSSPLGRAGLQDILRSVNNPAVSASDRRAVQNQVQDASFYASRATRLGSVANQADEKRKQAREDHLKSISDYRDSVARKTSADRNAKRAYDFRDAVQHVYATTLTRHLALGARSHLGPDVIALRQRLARAQRGAQQKARRARNAGAQARAARNNTRTSGSAYNQAARNATGARGAANTAQGQARRSAGQAAAMAAKASQLASYRATAMAVGAAASAVASFGSALLAAKRGINDFVERTNQHNRRLAGFSAAIGLEFARLNLGDVRRGFAVARGTEDSTVKLIKAIDRMRDSQLQGNIAWDNIKNRFAILGAGAVGGVDKAIGGVLKQLDDFLESVMPEDAGKKMESVGELITIAVLNALLGFSPTIMKMINDWWNGEKKDDDDKKLFMGPGDQFIMEMARGGARAGNGAPRAGRPRGFPNP